MTKKPSYLELEKPHNSSSKEIIFPFTIPIGKYKQKHSVFENNHEPHISNNSPGSTSNWTPIWPSGVVVDSWRVGGCERESPVESLRGVVTTGGVSVASDKDSQGLPSLFSDPFAINYFFAYWKLPPPSSSGNLKVKLYLAKPPLFTSFSLLRFSVPLLAQSLDNWVSCA